MSFSGLPKYRLKYFDVRALAEPIRWIFHYTGTPFIDDRIPWNNIAWIKEEKKKYTSTVGQIPILYEEGKPELSQSHVISRYLAKQFGLVGDNDWDDARVDEVISLVFDLYIYWRTNIIFESDFERRAKNRTLVEARFEIYYAKFNRMLEESGGPYILGKKLTHGDFWLASYLNIWDDPFDGDGPVMAPIHKQPSQEDMFLKWSDKFPMLKAHKENVKNIPEIKAWIERRHKTQA